METVFTIAVFLLFFWVSGIALGALLRGTDCLFVKLTNETREQRHTKSLKIVRSYIYALIFIFSLFSLIGIIAETSPHLGTLLLLFVILLLLSALWGTYIGIGRRYIPPIQFLKMLRKW